MTKPVDLIVIGAGNRGQAYAGYAKQNPERARISGVAEPRDFFRQKMADEHNITEQMQFIDWQQLLENKPSAQGVIIATQDRDHVAPAVGLARAGYNILLEKPMAPDIHGCMEIAQTARQEKILFAVCHVLRYTPYTKKLKQVLESGRIGEIVSIEHLEPVGFDHYAHSYVRGNWSNTKRSTFMLMAKSCHDIDWLRYIAGRNIRSLSSFGSLMHFRKESAPQGSGERCLDCAVEKTCPYSAVKIYLEKAKQKNFNWPVEVITEDLTVAGVETALREGPYGKCVYRSDNDVVDHQAVNIEFETGITAGFTMVAFTPMGNRQTKIFGTKGMITGDGETIEIYDFLTGKTEQIETGLSDGSILTGHGGGDYGIMQAFTEALANNDQGLILSGPEETLETHLATFAAEKARTENRVVHMSEFL